MAGKGVYRLSPLAERDLEDIWSYTVDTWSWEQAQHYHGKIVAALENLASGRSSGRRADIRSGYLKCPVGSHVVFYRIGESGIDIIRILHQRMDVSLHL